MIFGVSHSRSSVKKNSEGSGCDVSKKKQTSIPVILAYGSEGLPLVGPVGSDDITKTFTKNNGYIRAYRPRVLGVLTSVTYTIPLSMSSLILLDHYPVENIIEVSIYVCIFFHQSWAAERMSPIVKNDCALQT